MFINVILTMDITMNINILFENQCEKKSAH